MADDSKKTYYLKPGREHSAIVNGEIRTFTETNAEVELHPSQFAAFADKFNEEPVAAPTPPPADEGDEEKAAKAPAKK